MKRYINSLKELNFSLEKKAKDYADAELEEAVKQVDTLVGEMSETGAQKYIEGYDAGYAQAQEDANASYSNGYTEGEGHGYEVGFAEGLRTGRAEGRDL